ncbi:MAG: hypothetical protein Phog2KO_24760 [Phototrophicaceae bacterium]
MANTKALDWLTLSEDELNDYMQTNCIHPNSQELLENTYKKLLAGEDNLSVKIIVIHPNLGNILIDAKIKKANYFNDDNYWLATFCPVSQHMSSSLSTPQQMEVFDNQDLIEHNFFLTNVIREHRFTNNALNSFLVTLQDIIPYDSASINLLQEEKLHFIATRGLATNIFDFTFKIVKSISKSADVLYENDFGTVYTIANVKDNPNWYPLAGTEHIKSWMGVELNYEGEMLGLLNIDSAQNNFFTQDHARHALALAQQATLAIVYTRLHQQFENDIDERNHLQKLLVRNLINIQASYATQELLTKSDSLEESLPELMNVITSSLGRTQLFLVIFNLPTGKVLHKLRSFDASNDVWDIFSEVVQNKALPNDTMPTTDWALPPDNIKTLDDGRKILVAHVNRRGALIALREADTAEFNELDHELITSVATQINIALENELLNLQLRQHNEQLEKQIERRTTQLSFERKRLKAILDATAEGIFYMEDFTIRYANSTFCRMVGYGIDDLYGKPLSYVRVSPENNNHRNISNILDNFQEVESGRSETRLRHQDGTEFYVSIRFSLVGQPGESPVRMVAIARDISQERKLFFQRARFIANAAHELRTPLSSIILRLHMLRRQPERIETHLESLDRVTEYLREIVEELLTLSRFERGTVTLEKQRYPLQKIINESIDEQRPFAIEQGVFINTNLPPEDIIISVDYKRIHQMIGNLVLNAINYSDKKDTVDIIMSVEEDIIGNKNAIILIIDEGAGIEAELLPDDIFEPFSRPSGGTRKETGMGLALVREIAHLHGGNIQVTSVLGEGSTFRISIPID